MTEAPAELISAKEDELRGAAEGLGLIETLRESLIRYAVHGVATGGFLRSFLANDLMQSIGRADADSLEQFSKLALFVHNWLGADCHGSYEKVDAWTASPMTREKVAAHG